MARLKVTPRKGEDKRGHKVKTQAKVHAEAWEPPVPVDPQHQKERPIQHRVSWRRELRRQRGLGRWGSHQSHHQPDSWPRWLQWLGHLHWAGRSQPGGSSNQCGRKGPMERIPQGWQGEETLKVPTGNGGSL